ncbi:MAG TPA: TonB-dependent receptor plug domain-containing protein [Ferruginibacter sp.]|nr:TonB-dependent receptor plug domain-containing protein [Ferruginibacter sp.]
MKNIIVAVLLSACTLFQMDTTAQNTSYAYNKEKIYVHTDHVFYKPGDVMYFKIYLVNGDDQTPSAQSSSVFTEIISPSGTIAKKIILKVTDGYAEGSFEFEENTPGGIYKLRAYTSWMQNETGSTFFVKEITLQKYIAPRILMKLDFPQKGYGAGDLVTADFSVRSLADEPLNFYSAEYTVSLEGKVQENGKFTTNNKGKYQLQFRLPKNVLTTDALLNISMQYDGYTENISRSIPIVLNKIDLQFMPEGGTLVNGLQHTIAFKAINEFGKPVDVAGYITDKNGDTVTRYESLKFGMGKFSLQPAEGNFYTAHITRPANISQAYMLPSSDSRGIRIGMKEENNKLMLQLQSTYSRTVKVVAQSKGIDQWTERFELAEGIKTVEVNKEIFPAGIAQFTVYDETGRPVAERLFFMNTDKKLTLTITPGKQQYLPREKVSLVLQTTDRDNKPVPANLSLSVIDDKLWTMADDKQHNILSWLLLGSELKGKIEEPSFYFKQDEPAAKASLDLLMLTHGYRYYDFIPYTLEQGKLRFTGDLENMVSGYISNVKGERIPAKIYLVNPVSGSKAIYSLTGKDGLFFFSNLESHVNYSIIAQSLHPKEHININITQQGLGQDPFKETSLFKKTSDGKDEMAALIKPGFKPKTFSEQQPINEENIFGGQRSLNEVVVTGYGLGMQKRSSSSAINIVRADELINVNLLSNTLAGKVAGVSIQTTANPGNGGYIRIRGTSSFNSYNEPLYVVNGIPVSKLDPSLSIHDIENLYVFRDASATALYGSRAANGVIVINEKKASYNGTLKLDFLPKYYFATKYFTTTGTVYTPVKKFYAPLYESTETDTRNDFRETIYWNPVVQTDSQGKATVTFYNSDATTTFRAVAEGTGYNGLPGNAEKTYSSKAAIAADIKVPPYLTTGDKVLLPLTVKNNSLESKNFIVVTDTVKGIWFDKFDSRFTLEAGQSKQVLIPALAITTVKDNISVWVKTNDSRQQLIYPVEVAQKGFPVVTTIAGTSDKKDSFSISKVIPGSLQTELKLFKSVEGQLLDGIESMLREPGGCFEQTSSTTYPNVFILKYLKESGKSNPDVYKKAIGYIERGYKRLTGFETSENGFEWFGKAPAHEALTAYGLLEFTDMKEFVQVDHKMLQRTLAFLLKRRDGKGGFKIASGGYDRFRSVPNKIANVYIVYAVTQAGAGNQFTIEYNAAVKQAIESNDAYQMAMMALAADNMHNKEDYQLLMNQLNKQYAEKNMKSETSVVNSQDASLRVEVKSLYTLALLRSPKPDLAAAASLLSSIMNEKSYYGYGSTQATVLALQAVVNYSKAVGKQSADIEIEFTLNNRKINESTMPAEGQNNFEVRYKNNNEHIPYQYEVKYFTYSPPGSKKSVLSLQTSLQTNEASVGETVRLNVTVSNKQKDLQPMAIAKIGIPAGLSLQPWQLKQLAEENKVAYYEIFDNYLVLYWMGFAAEETKNIELDLKAEIPGTYVSKASNTYLYYTPEYKHWNEGLSVEVK